MRVYLAGPINQASDSEAKDWRAHATNALKKCGCETVDPMVRDYRGVEDVNVRRIVENDKDDILSADVLLANCPKPSVGTSMEVLFAHENGIRVVVVAPDPVSPWLIYHAERVFADLDSALTWIRNPPENRVSDHA